MKYIFMFFLYFMVMHSTLAQQQGGGNPDPEIPWVFSESEYGELSVAYDNLLKLSNTQWNNCPPVAKENYGKFEELYFQLSWMEPVIPFEKIECSDGCQPDPIKNKKVKCFFSPQVITEFRSFFKMNKAGLFFDKTEPGKNAKKARQYFQQMTME